MKLPNKKDFNAYPGYLDEESAWENFGDLTIDDAYLKFCENPINYQEDFMFMGWQAFKFYFPVIETYIQKATLDEDDSEFWILGCGIENQIEKQKLDKNFYQKIHNLAKFTIEKTMTSTLPEKEKKKINKVWSLIKKKTT